MTITRRLFLGRLSCTAAAAPLAFEEGWEPELVADVDREVGLSGDDILVVRIPTSYSCEEVETITAELERSVWPHVLLVSEGVELEVLKRAHGHHEAAKLFRSLPPTQEMIDDAGVEREPTVSLAFYEDQPRTPGR